MAKADYKFLTDIDLESNNIVNVSKIIGNDYENISPDLEITTEDKTEGQVGNLLLRAGDNETGSGYVHIYAGTSTEPIESAANLGIKILPDNKINIIDHNIKIQATTSDTSEGAGSSITLSNDKITYDSDEHLFKDKKFRIESTSADIGSSGLINIHSNNSVDLKSPDTDIIGENNLTLGNAEDSNYIEFTNANNDITIKSTNTLNTTAAGTTTIKTGESTITQTPTDTTIKSSNITAEASANLKASADNEILIQLPKTESPDVKPETSIKIAESNGLDIDSSKIAIDSTSTIDTTSKGDTTILVDAEATSANLKLESKKTVPETEASSILLNDNITVDTDGNYNQTVTGTTNITSTGKMTITAESDLGVKAAQLIDVDSNKLDINATESINLGIGSDNSENSSVVMKSTSITSTANTQTIKGNSITIQDNGDGNNKIELLKSDTDNTISITTNDTNNDKVDITSSNINLKSDKLDSITKGFNIYLDKDGRAGTVPSSSTTDYMSLKIDNDSNSALQSQLDNIDIDSSSIDIDSDTHVDINSSELTLGNKDASSSIVIRDKKNLTADSPKYDDPGFDILSASQNTSIYASNYLKIQSAETLDIDAKKLQLNPAEDFNLNSDNIHIIGSKHLHLTNNDITEASCNTTSAGIILNKGTTKSDIYINADSLTTTVDSYKLADADQSITLDSNSININNSSGSINLPKSLGDFIIEGNQAIKVTATKISLTGGNNDLTVDGTAGISLSANKITTKSDDTFISNSGGAYGLKVKESSNTLISSTNDIIASQINISTGTETDHTDKLTINETTSDITNGDINISANNNLTITAPDLNLTTRSNSSGQSMLELKAQADTSLTGIKTQNLKVNAVANFAGFSIYWDNDTNSLIFTEGELNWI